MTRLSDTFTRLRAQGETGFFPFLTAGYPSLEFTKRMMLSLSNGLADGFELGIPYSDPLADGPTIQHSSEWALEHGTNTTNTLEMLEAISDRACPSVLMTYYNVVFKYGLNKFAKIAVKAGAAGVIIPDLSIEEAGPWMESAHDAGLATIFMVAPTTDDARIVKIANACTGFVYCVSLTGVTGARTALPESLPRLLERIRAATDVPIVVGFGVSTGKQAESLRGLADGVIVGSAVVNAIKDGVDDDAREANVLKLAEEIMTGLGRI